MLSALYRGQQDIFLLILMFSWRKCNPDEWFENDHANRVEDYDTKVADEVHRVPEPPRRVYAKESESHAQVREPLEAYKPADPVVGLG